MNNGQWTIKVFPTEIILNGAQSAHHNCQLSIFNCQLFFSEKGNTLPNCFFMIKCKQYTLGVYGDEQQ